MGSEDLNRPKSALGLKHIRTLCTFSNAAYCSTWLDNSNQEREKVESEGSERNRKKVLKTKFTKPESDSNFSYPAIVRAPRCDDGRKATARSIIAVKF